MCNDLGICVIQVCAHIKAKQIGKNCCVTIKSTEQVYITLSKQHQVRK